MFLHSWRNHSAFLFLIKAFRICSVPVFHLLIVKISGFIVAWVTGTTSAINKRALGFGGPSRKECSHDAARMSLIGASSFQSIFTFQMTSHNTSTIQALLEYFIQLHVWRDIKGLSSVSSRWNFKSLQQVMRNFLAFVSWWSQLHIYVAIIVILMLMLVKVLIWKLVQR